MKYLVYRVVEAETEDKAIKQFRYGVGMPFVRSANHFTVINRDKVIKSLQKALAEEMEIF